MKDNVVALGSRVEETSRSALDAVIRAGAQKMLQAAIEAEVEEYVTHLRHLVDESGHRLVVRNGSKPEREILTGAGSVTVQQPRVHDRRDGHRFSSAILPPYLRRAPSLDALIPALYLKGVSTGDFQEALEAILGKNAAGLSASTVTRLKDVWVKDYDAWSARDLSEKHCVYLWTDGIHFNVRLEEDRTCILVLMGTLLDGTKELVAVHEGLRESKLSWQEVLRDLKRRGLTAAPALAVGDGALGFWAALEEEYGGAGPTVLGA